MTRYFGAVASTCARLVLYGAQDAIVPRRPMTAFVAACRQVPPHASAWRLVPRTATTAVRDLEGPLVTANVANWVLAPGAPLPSGADRIAAEAFSRGGSQLSLDAR